METPKVVSSYYGLLLEKWNSCITDEKSGELSFKKVASIAIGVFASVAGFFFAAGALTGRVFSFLKSGLTLGFLGSLGTVFLSFVCRDDLISVPKDLYNHENAVKILSDSKLAKCSDKDRVEFLEKRGGHEVAKKTFHRALKQLNLSVDFVSPPGDWDIEAGKLRSTDESDYACTLGSLFAQLVSNKQDEKEPLKPLNKNIFKFSMLANVAEEIKKVSKNTEEVHLFSIASTYSGGPVNCKETPPIGQATVASSGDQTSAIAFQKANPVVFEIANACLTNLGFNMLDKPLPQAGKTYASDSPIKDGHLKISGENAVTFFFAMDWTFSKVEVPCYESKIALDQESFFLILGASPTQSDITDLSSAQGFESFQELSTLAIFAAQFNQVKALLKKYPNKKIVFHVTDMRFGGTPLFNESKHFEEAFLRAANLFEASLSEEDKKRSLVQIDGYPPELASQASSAKYLGLCGEGFLGESDFSEV